MEICSTRRWGGVCLAHTRQLHHAEHRGSPNTPASNILSLCKIRRGTCSYFMQESLIAALLESDSFLRAQYIPFWKLSGLGDTCGKNFLSLADREPNPFFWIWTVCPLLEASLIPWFWRTQLLSPKASWRKSTHPQGLIGHRVLWNTSTPFLAWLPRVLFPPEALYKS